MGFKESKIQDFALKITELREQLRWRAAAVAGQPDQLKYYESKELEELSKQVSRQHYPLKGLRKRQRRRVLPEETPVGLRRRRRKTRQLSLD